MVGISSYEPARSIGKGGLCNYYKNISVGEFFLKSAFVIITKLIASKNIFCKAFFCNNFGRDGKTGKVPIRQTILCHHIRAKT